MPVQLEDFSLRMKAHALAQGFPIKPVNIKLMGPSNGNQCITRYLEVSETAPALHAGDDIRLWLKPSTLEIFKGDTAWKKITTYDDMFYENIAAPSVIDANGVASAPVLLQRDPQLPNEAVTKSYLDSVLALVTSGKLYVSAPVADIAALRLVDTTVIQDKQVIFVESVRQLFAYDLQGVGVDDGVDIVAPASNIGRWFSTSPTILSGGTF